MRDPGYDVNRFDKAALLHILYAQSLYKLGISTLKIDIKMMQNRFILINTLHAEYTQTAAHLSPRYKLRTS